jgi:hypothetical protein
MTVRDGTDFSAAAYAPRPHGACGAVPRDELVVDESQ